MVELPSVRGGHWRCRSWVLELALAALVACWAVVTSARVLRDEQSAALERAGAFVVPGLILLVTAIKVFRSRAVEMKFEPLEEPKDLSGLIKGLHSNLCDLAGCKGDALGVRIVIYKVIWDRRRLDPLTLEQVTSYVGGLGGLPGRTNSARAGIIGCSARMALPYWAKRESADTAEFRKELVEIWGYTAREAEDVSAERWAWMAVPLLEQDGTAYGVLYVDSKNGDLLDDERNRRAVLDAGKLIAETSRSVYNR